MSVAISFSSAFRPGVLSLVSGSLINVNVMPAFNSSDVRLFSTPGQAQRYIDSYMQKGQNATIINKEDINRKYF